MRKLTLAVGVILIGALPFVIGQSARSNPAAPAPTPIPQEAPSTTQATLTWSVPQLAQTIFPGTSSTVAVTFQSNQSLADLAVEITPSLTGIVSASPSRIASVTANRPYQIIFTLTAPPRFIQRSFGGTIQIRNSGTPANVYPAPLAVNLQTGWNTLSDQTYGFTVFYPMGLYEIPNPSKPTGFYDLESASAGVAFGGAVMQGSPVATSGFAITIWPISYDSTASFSITKYLSDTFRGLAADATVTSTTIAGNPAYIITFQGEEGGNQPLAIVFHNGIVYSIKYSSTDYVAGFSDQDGLTTFNAVLSSLSFTQ